MEILEAYDLTGSYRAAAELAGCDHHTVAHYVALREVGRAPERMRAERVADPFLAKIEEWVERSRGRVGAEVCHGKLVAMGYAGSERTTRRVVAEARRAWRAGNRRVYRPWIPEPGLWLQFDWGDGPTVAGMRTQLWCAWLAWSRFRVVLSTVDKTLPTLLACLDITLRRLGGVPTYALTEDVPRNIFRLLFPAPLCGRRRRGPLAGGSTRMRQPHNDQSDESQSSNAWSLLHIGPGRDASEVPPGSVLRSASIFAFVVISA
jgi:hypothetical protein